MFRDLPINFWKGTHMHVWYPSKSKQLPKASSFQRTKNHVKWIKNKKVIAKRKRPENLGHPVFFVSVVKNWKKKAFHILSCMNFLRLYVYRLLLRCWRFLLVLGLRFTTFLICFFSDYRIQAMTSMPNNCTVRVAVRFVLFIVFIYFSNAFFRIRPQSDNEMQAKSKVCTSMTASAQVSLGEDKTFTFDHVFDQNSKQQAIYEQCVKELVDGTFEGYNATVLAYGQVCFT